MPGNWPIPLLVAGLVTVAGTGSPRVAADERAATGRVATDRRPAPLIVRLTHEQGLSDDTVEAIVEDHRGFLWFGTQDGLNRYDDGYDFTVYRHDPEDPRSLSRSFISVLHEDRDGTLWIGTPDGLNRYDRETATFARYLNDPDDERTLGHDTVSTLYEDRAGNLWIGTYLGLCRWQPDSGTFVRYVPGPADPGHGLDRSHVRAILEDGRGFLWLGTEGDGLLRMDPKDGSFARFRHHPADPSSLCHDEVWDLLADARGRLWIATRGGLDRLDPPRPGGAPAAAGFRHFRHDPDDPVSPGGDHVDDLFEDSRGQLWIGYDGAGLDRYDEASGAFTHFRHGSGPNTLGGDVVRTIHEDSQGDLWIGIYTGGVSHLNQDNPFLLDGHRPGDPDSLSHDSVLSFFEDPDGTLWVGTEGGLNRYDPRTGRYRSYLHDDRDPASLSANAVLSIIRDRRGRLWVGTFFGGLDRLDAGDGFVHYRPEVGDPRSLGNPHVWDVHEDARGRLWLATFGGVDRLDPEAETFRHYRHDPGDPGSIGNAFVWAIEEDRSGTLWAATQGGLSAYAPELDAFRTYRSGLPMEEVLSIHEDRLGVLWVGLQGGGLARFDREREAFTVYGAAGGLPGGIVYCLLEDDAGFLWLSTSDGLTRFDPRTESFLNYDQSDGVLAKPFAKNACLRSDRGELLFGGGNGYVRFVPQAVQANPRRPPIVLTELEVFNRPVAIGPDAPLERHVTEAETIRLRHDQSVLSIGYAALSYRAPHKNRYAYKLEGFDKEWNHVGNQRTATYTNLDPGRYTFRVKGSNNSGLWNEEGAAIDLVVEPPLWRTWWAYGLYGLTLSALVFVFVEAQRRKVERARAIHEERERLIGELEARNAELARFNYTVAHDLRNPLVTIKNFLGVVRRDAAAGDKEALARDCDRLERAAETMHRQLEDLQELSRVDREASPVGEVQLDELVREALEELAGPIGERRIEVEVGAGLPTVRGDRSRLLEVFRHLLANAVAHLGDQPSPRIEVGVSDGAGGAPVLHVRDNGRGIDPRYHDRVFMLFERLDPGASHGTGVGLTLVKRIVEIHGGRIWVESEGRGRGSTFRFVLPVAGEGKPAGPAPPPG